MLPSRSPACLLVVIGVFLILDGKLTVGALVAANMLAGRVLAPIAGIASVITRGTQTLSSLKSIDRIMSLERERSPQRAYVSRKIEEGRIAFENVSFAYPNAPGNALEKVSFKIEGGERVGIIGRVGSGKTTVGRLLLGFYEAKEGRILIDGVDSRQYDPSDLRTGIGFAMQDTDLFFGKLRDNIALGKPEATDEEVLAAARLSGVESFIAGHPMGYDMPISEGGRSLSGGQKQAIGLARVLIRKPRVLFLDEPTAHFDIRSEAEFLERLKAIRGERMTIIISTHRLSLLNMVDRLLLFDNGRLVADGPRDKVLAILQGKPVPAPAPCRRTRSNPNLHNGNHWRRSSMPSSDFAFANDIRAAAALRTPRTSRMLLLTFLALLADVFDLGAFCGAGRGQARQWTCRAVATDPGGPEPRRRHRRRDPGAGRRHRSAGPVPDADRRHQICLRVRRNPGTTRGDGGARRPARGRSERTQRGHVSRINWIR